jgi:hypothetical protein
MMPACFLNVMRSSTSARPERHELQGWHPLKEGGFKSQLIHKEWPETYGEKLKDGTSKRRGSFDIAIVTLTSCAERASTSSGSAASLPLS